MRRQVLQRFCSDTVCHSASFYRGHGDDRAATSVVVTIYNQDLALIGDTRNVTVKKGKMLAPRTGVGSRR